MQTLHVSFTQCLTCGTELEPAAKFCGHCGALTPAQAPPSTFTPPTFAQVTPTQPPAISEELKSEAAKLLMQLARERILLLFHFTLFVGTNILGCYLALKCYNEFIGDELTKIMIASTPFLYINSLSLLCIILIKGTRKEIARLKERISYVRFKIEFGHLM